MSELDRKGQHGENNAVGGCTVIYDRAADPDAEGVVTLRLEN